MDAEQWKDVVGFEGKYQVSDLGRVRNVRRHILKPQLVNSGYLVVHLYGEAGRQIPAVIVAGLPAVCAYTYRDSLTGSRC